MQRSCDSCGQPYEAKTRRSRYCSKRCAKRGERGAKVVEFRSPEPPDAAEPDPTVVAATRAVLAEAGRLECPAGAAALALARKLDQGRDTGSSMAALTRELRATLADATADAEREADPVDELRRQRERRLRGA